MKSRASLKCFLIDTFWKHFPDSNSSNADGRNSLFLFTVLLVNEPLTNRTSINYIPICPDPSLFYEHAYLMDALLVSQIESRIQD